TVNTFNFTDYLGDVLFKKVDKTSGEAVGFATFEIKGTDADPPNSNVDITVKDNESGDLDNRPGYVKVGGLYTGNYEISETVAAGKGDVGSGITTTFADDQSAITTTANSASHVGVAISDAAHLSHVRLDAGGSISFKVYGPFPEGYVGTQNSCTADKLLTTL